MAPRNAAPKPTASPAARGRKRAAQTHAAENDDAPPTPVRASKRARTLPATSYAEADEDEDDESEKPTAKTTPRKGAKGKDQAKPAPTEADEEPKSPAKKTKPAKSAAAKSNVKPEPAAAAAAADAKPNPRKRAPADKKDADMPLAPRTTATAHLLGAHVSAAGGVQNALGNAVQIGANAFALFLKSQRKWANPPLKDEHALAFAHGCKAHGYDPGTTALPHGSYLVNLATADKDKAAQAYDSFLDDLHRCDALNIRFYNFHPGNTNGAPRAAAISRLAAQLNNAHKATARVVTLLENMAAAPEANTIGGRFEDLRDTINLVEDKSRVGVCLDTCHAFAGGYDLRSPEAYAGTMAHFDATVGLQYLRAWHLNDSKGVFGSHRDLHQNIGAGFLGLRAFHNLMNDTRMHGMPMILETPIDHKDEKGKSVEDKSVWAREIKLLESLVGMDVQGEEFGRLESELAERGKDEREKLQAQFDKKAASPQKKKGGARKRKAESEGEESE